MADERDDATVVWGTLRFPATRIDVPVHLRVSPEPVLIRSTRETAFVDVWGR